MVLLPGSVVALALALGLTIYQSERHFQQKSESVKESIGHYAHLMAEPMWNFNVRRVDNII